MPIVLSSKGLLETFLHSSNSRTEIDEINMFSKEFTDTLRNKKRLGQLKPWLNQLDGNDSESDDDMDTDSQRNEVRLLN